MKAAGTQAPQREIQKQTTILVVEDEPNMVNGLRDNFEYEGYNVLTAMDGLEGLQRALEDGPDVVVLDVMMPKMSGLEVCKQLRAKRPSLPIIMLTARGQEVDKVVGLELGADDYVTKPFELPELLARVRAILRRARALKPEEDTTEVIISQGDLSIDLETHRVSLAGKPVELSPTEFRLLGFLVQNRGKIVSHSQILANVWGPDYHDQIAYVKLYIRYLREKIEADPGNPELILTERGFGYKFAGPSARALAPQVGAAPGLRAASTN